MQSRLYKTVGCALLLWVYPSYAQQPSTPLGSPVTSERLLKASEEPENWLMYSGQYNSQRHSRLTAIDKTNVDQLEVKWVKQLETLADVETTPLVVDGVMYLTQSPSNVIALDASTGSQFWTYEHTLPEKLSLCCGRQNRGVAILGETLFLGTLDAKLIALDAKTGAVQWEVQSADPATGYSKTAAPLVIGDKVISGIAGGEYGIRGFLDAYDAKTGELAWRFYTIPGEGEPHNDTWEDDSWKTGGAPTWITGAYDPDLNLVYWGTGNPGPDWNGEAREGDNLYSDSVVALDADTGELKWHFQFTPHDVHDWDATQIPILIDIEFDGRPRKLMLFPNRNGFFYVLDRVTGEFLRGTAFAKQTWAERIDENGRPIRIPGMLPNEEGVLVYPSVNGAANWWSNTYSPRTELLYVVTYDGADTFYIGEDEYVPGEMFVGGAPERYVPQETYASMIRALDPRTGDTRWEFPLQPKTQSGLLSTASDLVFGGSVDGYFYALDAVNGAELWRINVGGNVKAAPISYMVGGVQYVTVAAGNAILTFGLD
jgi:alcohol dehydrogenase (cytochrome c)